MFPTPVPPAQPGAAGNGGSGIVILRGTQEDNIPVIFNGTQLDKIILLTHYEDSPGAALADVVLLCGAQESPLDSGSIPIKVAVLYVGEVLLLRYMMDDPETANTAQDRTSEAVAMKLL